MYINEEFQITTWYKPYCLPIETNCYNIANNKPDFEFIYINQDIPYYVNESDGSDLWQNDFITKPTLSKKFTFHDQHLESDIYPFTIYHADPITTHTYVVNPDNYDIDVNLNNIVTFHDSFFADPDFHNGLIYASYIPFDWELTATEFRNKYINVSFIRTAPILHVNHIIRMRMALNDIVIFINVTTDSNLNLFTWTGGYNNTLSSTSPDIINSFSLFALKIINELIDAINTIKNSEHYAQTILGSSIATEFPTIEPLTNYKDTCNRIYQIQGLINNIENELIV